MPLSIVPRIWFAVALALLATPAAAFADDAGTGGAAMPDKPEIENAICEDAGVWTCGRGAHLTLSGRGLAGVKEVRFLGRRGREDDRVARAELAEEQSVQVVVPRGARSGRVAVVTDVGRAVSAQPVKVTAGAAPRTAPASPGAGVFPIAGPHEYGTETNRFGGGRGHGGQDVFAKCGTPLVALYDTTVQHKAFQSRAGNYVVLQTADGASYAYMHLQAPASVDVGDVLRAGDAVGKVGDTGRATGCHLHFEQWTAPGWYEGGEAVDPLPLLRSLDKRR